MEVPSVVSNAINNPPSNTVLLIIVVVALVIFYVIKKIYDLRNSVDKYVIYRNLIKGNQAVTIENDKLPLIRGTYENTYSMWLHINNTKQNNKATHIMHVGDSNLTKAGPSIWLHPYKNNLSIKFSLLNKEMRFTDGKVGGAPANTECKFPYKINWSKLGMVKPPSVGDNTLIRTCQQTTVTAAPNGYCPTKVSKSREVENIKDFGSCGPASMNPNINTGLLNSQICDIENFPLKRWVNLVITVNNDIIEVYIDGRLVKTCVTNGLPFINEGDVFIFKDKDFDGVMMNLKAYPYTMSSSQVYDLYMGGPNEDNSLLGFFKKLFTFSIKITFPDSNEPTKTDTTAKSSTTDTNKSYQLSI
jgi:hypothetical protein